MHRAKLLLDSDLEVAETIACVLVVVIIRSCQSQLSLRSDAEAKQSFRKIERALAIGTRFEESVFKLQGSNGNDDARVGEGRAIRRDRARLGGSRRRRGYLILTKYATGSEDY